jgi:NAD(P)-dependent dehydrogenase (short-subunit alcohol dehydrogenase family)
MMDVNFMGVVHATQAVLPGMVERRHGRIVAVASTAGLKGYAYVSAYSAAKHAVIASSVRWRWKPQRAASPSTRVCPVSPITDLLEGSIDNIIKKTGRSREQAIAELSKHNPQGRLVAPSEVADTVLWLCGEGAGAITGQAIAGCRRRGLGHALASVCQDFDIGFYRQDSALPASFTRMVLLAGQEYWATPGGGVEHGETFEQGRHPRA